jgi:hypothetical protein
MITHVRLLSYEQKNGQKTELQRICYGRPLQKRRAIEPCLAQKTMAGISPFLIGCQDIFIVVAKG